ncbi:MAG: tetratricopeptide repeat protein [Bacteroidetes bacterium]|nr:tetratricopeptide repeat protein [Bacteroidota bacterium]
MKSERIKMLEQFVAEDPTDPFNQYALALELAPVDKGRAKKIFDELITSNPSYVPSYYQAAILYLDMDLSAEASKIIKLGIAEARKQHNMKAAGELNALLDELYT